MCVFQTGLARHKLEYPDTDRTIKTQNGQPSHRLDYLDRDWTT